MRDRLDFHKLVFPKTFTSTEAKAWGSLYGFEHGRATYRPETGAVQLVQRPQREFADEKFRRWLLRDDVVAFVGHAPVRRPKTAYERRSQELRELTIKPSRPAPLQPNDDLASWYAKWVVRTHPNMTDEEHAIAYAIRKRLRHLDRPHAKLYIAKLRASPLNG